MKTISSQRYINDEIVASKIDAEDFEVLVSPLICVDGEEYRVVLDGHHSLKAAMLFGVEPIFIEADARTHDAVTLIANGEVEAFLTVTHMGSGYYDVATGADIW